VVAGVPVIIEAVDEDVRFLQELDDPNFKPGS